MQAGIFPVNFHRYLFPDTVEYICYFHRTPLRFGNVYLGYLFNYCYLFFIIYLRRFCHICISPTFLKLLTDTFDNKVVSMMFVFYYYLLFLLPFLKRCILLLLLLLLYS